MGFGSFLKSLGISIGKSAANQALGTISQAPEVQHIANIVNLGSKFAPFFEELIKFAADPATKAEDLQLQLSFYRSPLTLADFNGFLNTVRTLNGIKLLYK
jgi:hypothetical protein